MKAFITLILSQLPIIICAAPSDHGRPWDDPNYHSSPLNKIFLPIAIIVLIILAIGWIGNNKEKVGNILGNILKNGFSILCVGGLIFGFVILPMLDRADRASTSSNYSTPVVSNSASSAPTVSSTEKTAPKEGEIGYKTKTYRIDVCRTCHGTGRYTVDANWGKSTINCPTCHGTGKERIAGNYH